MSGEIIGNALVRDLIVAVVVAVLAVPILYLWAWALGPAVRLLGRRFEEGRQGANRGAAKEAEAAYWRGLNDAWSGRVRPAESAPLPSGTPAPAVTAPTVTAPPPPAPTPPPTSAPEHPQSTITGKRIK
jgi:hypothetical protein